MLSLEPTKLVLVAAAVEDDRLDAQGPGALGDELADLVGGAHLVALDALDDVLERGGGAQRVADRIVDDLGDHVAVGAGDDTIQDSFSECKRFLLFFSTNFSLFHLMKALNLLTYRMLCFGQVVSAVDYDIESYQGDLALREDNTATYTEKVTYKFNDDYNGQIVSLGSAGKMPNGFAIDGNPTVSIAGCR